MHPSVLLLHTLPDGSSHYDWMIRRPDGGGGGGGGLITFRLSERLDAFRGLAFVAQRLADHRREYLAYEGEIPGDRGRVQRIAEGSFEFEADAPERFCVRGHLGSLSARIEGSRHGGNRWLFTVERD
jgi:hypothetical protein